MKKILTIAVLLAATTLACHAQSVRNMKVYQKSGVVDTLWMDAASQIAHSRLDSQGRQQDDYVMMRVSTVDGEHQYLLSQLDSIVLPNGRTVLFRGSMVEQPVLARQVIGMDGITETEQPILHAPRGPLRSSFSGTFPGTVGSGNVTFYWAKNDPIRLDVGYQSRATNLTNGNRDAEFVFTDEDFESDSYVVYYPDKSVTIPTVQTQWGADNSEHIGESGDCGAATATRQADDSFLFTLEHKAAYLCFLPHINNMPSVKVTKIVLTSNETTNCIAGTYQVAKAGLYAPTDVSRTITLHLNPVGEKDFFIGHDVRTEQDSCAAYMVIKPQVYNRAYMVTYYLTDTLSHMERTYQQKFTPNYQYGDFNANTVYPITCNIPDNLFRAVNLGLSTAWGNRNIGATEPSKVGDTFATAAEANATLLDETVVTQWLIPNDKQKQELIDKCTWKWGEYNHQTGYFVVGAAPDPEDGNIHRIFLPATSGQTPEQVLAANWRPVEALMVDLGLPSGTQWASHNMGALSPEAYGDYYAWGELETKHYYNDDTYQYNSQLIGYNRNINDTPYDVAHHRWGGLWRMPTPDEATELLDDNNCTWQLTTLNGVNGYKVTSVHNGNSIFLPSAGVTRDASVADYASSNCGAYLTSQGTMTSNAGVCTMAWRADAVRTVETTYTSNPFSGSYIYYAPTRRSYGHTIRPVATVNAVNADVVMSVATTGSDWSFGDVTATLHGRLAAITPIEESVTVGFVVGETFDVTVATAYKQLSQPQTIGGDFSLPITLYENVGYYYRAYVKVGEEYYYGEAKHVGLEMVDLGLPSGIKWANMNIGADTPEDLGEFYSWGETTPKERYASGDYQYNNQEIGADIGGTKYDAATANWGELWRIPSQADFTELLANVSWSTITIENVTYWKATSKVAGYEDKYLLFRVGGRYNSSSTGMDDAGYVNLMTSTRYNNTSIYYLQVYSSNKRVSTTTERYRGMTIRPVINATHAISGTTTVAHVATENCSYTVGGTTALLTGSVATSAAVDGMTYGFVVGTDVDVDAATAEQANIISASNLDSNHQFSIDYSHDGSTKFFRAFVKVGDNYYQGKVMGITAANMLDVVFKTDGTAVDASPLALPVSVVGTPLVEPDDTYNRNRADFTGNVYGSTTKAFYQFDYRYNGDFQRMLADGHTIEVLMRLPEDPSNNNEASPFSGLNGGSSGFSVRHRASNSREICAVFRIANSDRITYTGVVPAANTFYHVVAVWNKADGNIKVYLNGELTSTLEQTGDLALPSEGNRFYTVGGRPNGVNSAIGGWTGQVVEARIYDDPLTPDQVQTLWTNVKK